MALRIMNMNAINDQHYLLVSNDQRILIIFNRFILPLKADEVRTATEKSGTGRTVIIYVQVFWLITDLWIRIGVQVPQCGH